VAENTRTATEKDYSRKRGQRFLLHPLFYCIAVSFNQSEILKVSSGTFVARNKSVQKLAAKGKNTSNRLSKKKSMAKISINLKQGSIVRESDVIVGIDLGTTNSLVAYIKDGNPICVKGLDDKHTLVPSVVYLGQNEQVKVGNEAKQHLIDEPHRTIYSVKRLMGKSYRDIVENGDRLAYRIHNDDTDSLVKIEVDGRFYTPIELSALILGELKRRIEAVLGANVRRAVITVPAYFNDIQRQATRDAGKLAGLDVLRIVNEPTAASLAYGLGLPNSTDQIVAVYDLGGGTFDISILRIAEGVFEVLATNGDTFLGGDDIDKAIVQHWQTNRESFCQNVSLLQKMRLLAEKAKKHLSFDDVFTESIDNQTFTLTKKELEGLAEPLIQRTLLACKNALADAQIPRSEMIE
jgi:Molecular chaperone